MILEALQTELFRFEVDSVRSKIPKLSDFSLFIGVNNLKRYLEPNVKKAQEALSAGNADADAKNADLEAKLSNLEDELAKLRKELEASESDKTELQQQLFQVKYPAK